MLCVLGMVFIAFYIGPNATLRAKVKILVRLIIDLVSDFHGVFSQL